MSIFFQHWKNYLLLLSTISYIAGIALHARFSLNFTSSVMLTCAVSALFIVVIDGGEKKILHASILLFIFFFFGVFQGDLHDRARIDENHIAAGINGPQPTVIIGTLSKMVTVHNGISRALVRVFYMRTSESALYEKTSGTIILNLKGLWPESVLPGRSFIVRAEVQPPRVTNVPGTFNYRKYLARKNIYLTGFAQSPVLIQPVEALPSSMLQKVFYSIERTRYHIGQRIDASLPGTSGTLYRALLIGDRSSIDDDLYETLKRAGILHILAISGMHLGLLAIMFFSIIYWLMRRSQRILLRFDTRKYALLLSLPLLLFYAFLAGFQPPVVRSLIMTACLAIGYTINRLQSPLTTLASAALLILLFDPLAIESAAFQLSFTALASIILMAPPLQSLLVKVTVVRMSAIDKMLKLIFTLLAVTIAASIGTLPLMLLHFNRVSVVGVIANLLIEPLICLFSLPLGFAGVVLMYLSPQVSGLVLDIGAFGLDLAIDIASFLSGPAFTQVWLPAPETSFFAIYYLSLGLILAARHLLHWSIPGFTGFVTALMAVYLPLSDISTTALPATRISILDVGHGSANVLELKSGRVVLIDGGAQNSPAYDCGSRIIAPFLWARKIAKVHDIFLTHDDADHYSGIASVIERFNPDRLWIPGNKSMKKGFEQLLAYARDSGVRIVSPEPGLAIATADETITILGANTEPENTHATPANHHAAADDNGLVIQLGTAQATVLFPGDITSNREQRLIARSEKLKSDILLSPHHGSSTSNSHEFLAAVDPDIIIFSNGKNRRGLFPARETMDRVRLLDIVPLETSTQGTITITMGAESGSTPAYRISTYNITAQTYWSRG